MTVRREPEGPALDGGGSAPAATILRSSTPMGLAHALCSAATAATVAAVVLDAVRRGAPVAEHAFAFAVAFALVAGTLVVRRTAGRLGRSVPPRAVVVIGALAAALSLGAASGMSFVARGAAWETAVGAVLFGIATVAVCAARLAMGALAHAAPPLAPWIRLVPTGIAGGLGVVAAGLVVGFADDEPAAVWPWVALAAAAALLGVSAVASTARFGRGTTPGSTPLSGDGAPAARPAPPAHPRPQASPALLQTVAMLAAGIVPVAALLPVVLLESGALDASGFGLVVLGAATAAAFAPLTARVLRTAIGTERTVSVLATVLAVAALVAPLARPGALAVASAAAVVLGWVAFAGLVETLRSVRESPSRPSRGAAIADGRGLAATDPGEPSSGDAGTVIALAGAAGALLAGLLAPAVPIRDVLLGFALLALAGAARAWIAAAAARRVDDEHE